MPFVSDIVGPQRPLQRWPMPAHQDVELRASDLSFGPSGAVATVDEVSVRARLADRVIDEITLIDGRELSSAGRV